MAGFGLSPLRLRGLDEEDEELPPEEPTREEQLAALDALASPPEESAPVVETAPPPRPTPKGYGPGLGVEDLARAQSDTAQRQYRSDLRASMYSTGAGTPRPRQTVRDDAGDLMQRRQAVGQDEELRGRQRAAEINAERADPAGQSSQIARALLRKALPEVWGQIGPQADRLSHTQITENFPFMKELIEAERRRGAASKKAGLDAAGEAAVDREIKKFDPEFDGTGMPYEVKKAILDAKMRGAGIANTKKHQAVTEKQGETRLGLQGQVVEQGAERLGLKKKSQAMHVSQTEVPDVVPEDEQNPHALTTTQAAALQNQRAAVDAAQHAIDFTKEQIQKYGRRFANPLDKEAQTALGTVRSRITEALPQLSAANGFGNPTVSHIELSHASLGGDPTDFVNLMNQGRLPAILDSVMDSANNRYAATLHASAQRRMRPGERRPVSPFKPEMMSKRQKAEKWVRDHPDDPRAADILKKLGLTP